MRREEFNKIFNYVKNEYSDFTGDYDEWYGVLGEYAYQDILKKIQERRTSTAPIHTHLIKGLKPEEKIADWITECDICKERITIHNNDMTDYETHRRKCSKIDFINDISLRIKHEPINKSVYYNMSDTELEKAYRQVMDYYLKAPKEDVVKKI